MSSRTHIAVLFAGLTASFVVIYWLLDADAPLPSHWDRKEIEKGAPPYGPGEGRTYVLAWKVEEDNRRHRSESCLVLTELADESTHGRWCLATIHPMRPADDRTNREWMVGSAWMDTFHPSGRVSSLHVFRLKRFKERPGNAEIYAALHDGPDGVAWEFHANYGRRLVAEGVRSQEWLAATGERPIRFFTNVRKEEGRWQIEE